MIPAMQKILPILLVIFIVACDGHKHQDALLDRADSQLDADPRAVLSFVDSIARDCDLTRSQRMRLELIRAQAQNKAIINFTTDSLVLQLAEYYENHGTPNDRMKAYYMVGCAYRDLEDAPTALKYCRMAVEQADTTSRDCDLKTLSRIHGQIAAIYLEVAAFDLEYKEDFMAEKLSWQAKDTLSALIFASYRAAALLTQYKYDEASSLFDSIMHIEHTHDVGLLPEFVYPQRIRIALDRDHLEEAKKLFSEYERKAGIKPTSPKDDIIYGRYHFLKSSYYREVGKIDSAIYQSRRLLEHTDILDSKEAAYREMLEAFSVKHIPDSMAKYAKLYCLANDSTTIQRSSELMIRMQTIYNYTKVQEKAAILEQDAANMRVIVFVCITFVLFVGYVAYSRYKHRAEQERHKLMKAHREYMQLWERLDEKSHELKELQKDAVNYQQRLEGEILELQRSITRYRAEAPEISKWDEEHALYNNAAVRHLHGLAARGESATYREIESIADIVRAEFPSYYAHISSSQPPLLQREIQVCVLMRLRFQSSEIGTLLGVSAQSITNAKSAINKKLFNTPGAKTLEDHLLAIK